ncbi:ThuA domain-containing protein [Micromonospora sp. NPDC048898]|uniref:ThuA domain-containing protein n=1 Tax=Micromonospora sp. NPDC048898 TaxID=3364260 RepID=UPI0037196901
MPVDTVIFSGEGSHADAWHAFAETSAAIANLVGEAGQVAIVTAVDHLAAALDGARLLVVNASADRTAPIAEDQEFGRVLDDFLAGGGGLLALHSATIAFPQLATWRSTVGAAWERGRTFHPPIGTALIRRTDVAHPITAGLLDFEVYDERYTDLELLDGVDVETLYVHDEGGATHPLVWARTAGSGRVVYDALGHDTRSYESPGHVELLRRILAWLRHEC